MSFHQSTLLSSGFWSAPLDGPDGDDALRVLTKPLDVASRNVHLRSRDRRTEDLGRRLVADLDEVLETEGVECVKPYSFMVCTEMDPCRVMDQAWHSNSGNVMLNESFVNLPPGS